MGMEFPLIIAAVADDSYRTGAVGQTLAKILQAPRRGLKNLVGRAAQAYLHPQKPIGVNEQ
jgi:hypothetical protein